MANILLIITSLFVYVYCVQIGCCVSPQVNLHIKHCGMSCTNAIEDVDWGGVVWELGWVVV